jgi:hypothetical protein
MRIQNSGEREITVFHKRVREREKSRDAGSERMGKVVETSGPFLKRILANLPLRKTIDIFLPVGTVEFLST